MKNLNWALAATGIAFMGFMYGLMSLNYAHYDKKMEQEQAKPPIANTTRLLRLIKFDTYAKDANSIPVEITVIGQQGNYPNADYLMKRAARQYVSERMTEEILLEHSDGTVRMSFYIPTMPLN